MMPFYTDQLNRMIEISAMPQRIISLVPSQTELLFDLGLDKEVIGITKFCVHPENWFRNKQRIGGTKNVNVDLVSSLKPDLVIANKEENKKEQVEALEKIAPVWISDVNNTTSAFDMMQSVGEITGKQEKANELIHQIKNDLASLSKPIKNYRTAYLIWKDPYMTVGGDTFIHDMLRLSGFENVFGDVTRYPQIITEELISKKTELILLSTEPYPFKQKHIDELQFQLPGAKILLVDGEMFSWYGSRMLYAAGYLNGVMKRIVSSE